MKLNPDLNKILGNVVKYTNLTSLNQWLVVLIGFIALNMSHVYFSKFDLLMLIVILMIGYSMNKNVLLSLGISAIVMYVYVFLFKPILFPSKRLIGEGFEDNTDAKTNSKTTSKKYKSKKSSKKNGGNRTSENMQNVDNETGDHGDVGDSGDLNQMDKPEQTERFELDTDKTRNELYKTLDKKQIKNLTDDTQNLIKVQQDLMKLLNEMGPSLQNGKQILQNSRDQC